MGEVFLYMALGATAKKAIQVKASAPTIGERNDVNNVAFGLWPNYRAAGSTLHTIDDMNLPLVWPVFRIGDQTRPDRIAPHIIPFFRIAFVVTQQVIEEAGLPETFQFSAFEPLPVYDRVS